MVIDNIQLSVSASIGIAVYPQDGIEMDSLLKFADIALYQAKAAGRHCHRFFAADMNLRVSEQVALEQALRHAIGTDQLYVEFQPIMHAKSGRLASMEALMRWRHPELGQVPPGKFIPIAEESGLIEAIGEIAIRQTVAQLRQWSDMRLPKVPIAVNVAPTQLDRADFVQSVARIAAEAGIDMTLLRFEITESAVVRNIEHVIGTLQALRDHGSKILVDDFGTGYSNLSHLARLPVDTLKIDRSFVQDMDTIASREAIVRSVISMAKELRLSITAEGVETEAQFNMLRELGCTFIQGYYYSRPLPARRCTALLRKAIRKRLAARTG
jgi:predicted signal transduction protein with EAL and GGDEF domain